MQWTIPKIDRLYAAFHDSDDGLVPVDGQGDVARFLPQATQTQAMWRGAIQIADLATLLVTSPKTTSIGIINGNLIVEGRAKLNFGLLQLSTRSLPADTQVKSPAAHNTPSATTFRKNLWQILSRLHDAQLLRAYRFDFGGTTGDVHCNEGKLRFGGGFAGTADFVAALRAACEAGTTVAYTLADIHDDFGTQTASVTDILCEAVEVSDNEESEFDPDGWPLVCARSVDFGKLQILSDIAIAACAKCDDVGEIELKGRTAGKAVVLAGRSTDDRTIILSLI